MSGRAYTNATPPPPLTKQITDSPVAGFSGVLEKQKGTMKTWPKRFCRVREGKLSWAETAKTKEKGKLYLSEIVAIERKATEEKPFQFVVRTEDKAIHFAAENETDVEAWMQALKDDEEEPEPDEDHILRRFPARLVRSEEVVVTVRANLGLEISKYVGGGFRLRLDEVQRSAPVQINAEEAKALGLEARPKCVVCSGVEPWSAADDGLCFLATDNKDWEVVERAVEEGVADSAVAHAMLAGWKLAPQWWQLFSLNADDDFASSSLLERLEQWLHNERPDLVVQSAEDDRVRFPNRYGPPPRRALVKNLVVSVSLPSCKKVEVPCGGDTTLDELLDELMRKYEVSKDRCALRVAGLGSYVCRRDAPLAASADFLRALRDSVKPVATVNLVLETDLSENEVVELKAAHERLVNCGDALVTGAAVMPANELAAALRERPPNVHKLAALPDASLEPYVPQLVQALKCERLGEATPLVKFLLARALQNPVFVGGSVFWALRSEMSRGGSTAVRHGCLLAAFLAAVGSKTRANLEKQVVLDSYLRSITATAAAIDDKQARTASMQRELRRLARSGELPAGMDLPCMPGKVVGSILPDKCRVLSSKAAPILLVFEDPETDDVILTIFKTRDDLRQDAAMLQSMRQMDALWLDAGYECWLRTYTVMATDVDVGWIEVVRDAKETAEIQANFGSGVVSGALQNTTLKKFLQSHNEDPMAYTAARERFAASCAACCVATYVLGIADRHNGNIMLSTDGRLFHIDFGHVLGHFKKLKGTKIKREQTKLVLTPEMMYVINDNNSALNDKFVAKCGALIGVLRDRGNKALIFQLLKELVPADLPEINDDSIKWLGEILLKQEDADLRAELASALNDWVRRLDNANHNRIHQNSPSGKKTDAVDRRRVSTILEAQQEIDELRAHVVPFMCDFVLRSPPLGRRAQERRARRSALPFSMIPSCFCLPVFVWSTGGRWAAVSWVFK